MSSNVAPACLVTHQEVVICVPCYNESEFIEQTLSSIAKQTYRNFAVLMVDNASTDGTPAAIERAVGSDSRFTLHQHVTNIGAAANFNFGLESSASPFFAWVGAHDVLHPDFLNVHVNSLKRNREASVSQSRHAWIDLNGEVIDIISDGDMSQGGKDSLDRYFASIKQNRNNIGINSLLRRSYLDDVRFRAVVGTDRIILSHLAYRGPFVNHDGVLYQRRSYSEKSEDYMTRLAGRGGAALDWNAFAEACEADLLSLHGQKANAALLRLRLWAELRYRLPVRRGTLVTETLWLLRRVLKYSDPREWKTTNRSIIAPIR